MDVSLPPATLWYQASYWNTLNYILKLWRTGKRAQVVISAEIKWEDPLEWSMEHSRETSVCCCPGGGRGGNMLAWSHGPLDWDAERVIFGDVQEPGAPPESPYKEVHSGRVERGLSASLPLLDGANLFASTQHLRPLSCTNLTPAPESDCVDTQSTRSTWALHDIYLNATLESVLNCIRRGTFSSWTLSKPYPSPPFGPVLHYWWTARAEVCWALTISRERLRVNGISV